MNESLSIDQYQQSMIGPTSGTGVRVTGQPLLLLISGALAISGTSSFESTHLWDSYVYESEGTVGTAVAWSTLSELTAGDKEESARAAVCELRRRSGLTWEQLGDLLGVSRRSVHFWASGKPLSAENEQHVFRTLDVIREADRGRARETRAALLAVQGGASAFDLLAEGRFEEARSQLGQGVGRQRSALPALGSEAQRDRAPLSPGEVVEALHDRKHRDPDGARAARTSRNSRHGSS